MPPPEYQSLVKLRGLGRLHKDRVATGQVVHARAEDALTLASCPKPVVPCMTSYVRSAAPALPSSLHVCLTRNRLFVVCMH